MNRTWEFDMQILEHDIRFELTQEETVEATEGQKITILFVTSENEYDHEFELRFPGGLWSDAKLVPLFDTVESPIVDEVKLGLSTEDPKDLALLATMGAYLVDQILEDVIDNLRAPWTEEDAD